MASDLYIGSNYKGQIWIGTNGLYNNINTIANSVSS